jgi:hypothetical protein
MEKIQKEDPLRVLMIVNKAFGPLVNLGSKKVI